MVSTRLSLTLYFIKSLITFPLQWTPYHTSSFWYYFPAMFGEFIVIIGLTSFCVLLICVCSLNIIKISFIFLCMAIVRILILDVSSLIIENVTLDMSSYLQYDFRKNGYRYGPDYAYFEEMNAYLKHYHFLNDPIHSINTKCTICLDDFIDDPIGTQKQLLYCGHIFHKICIEKNEETQWNDNESDCYNPYSPCPNCMGAYHSHFEKYEFDESYDEKVSHWYPKHNYFGADFLKRHVWSKYDSTYNVPFHETGNKWVAITGGWKLPPNYGGC